MDGVPGGTAVPLLSSGSGAAGGWGCLEEEYAVPGYIETGEGEPRLRLPPPRVAVLYRYSVRDSLEIPYPPMNTGIGSIATDCSPPLSVAVAQ